MRLIYTTHDPLKVRKFSDFLTSKGIKNQLDQEINTDWENPSYGDNLGRLWVYDEDLVEKAIDWLSEFEKNPGNKQFEVVQLPEERVNLKNSNAPSMNSLEKINLLKSSLRQRGRNFKNYQAASFQKKVLGRITLTLLTLCSLIFGISEVTSPKITSFPSSFPLLPLTASPLKKLFLFDYPKAYALVDKLERLYGIDKLQNLKELPSEGQFILKEFYKTSYFKGEYDLIVEKLKGKEIFETQPPLFEKIHEGEYWRLFTPCLLHNDILHILFNMMWLILLGKQIEERLRGGSYILLMIVIGIGSNLCQYFMSGPNFMGFSGVLCGLLTFIWIRQKIAPWEGYPLERSTFLFMIYFIFIVLFIQGVSFYLEVEHNTLLSIGIANTAHLSGAAIGVLLGYCPFFSWKTDKIKGLTK